MGLEDKYFNNITKRERSIFEGAITMGALFHQFIGTPVNSNNVESLEKAIKDAMQLQPCIKKVRVKINREKIKGTENKFQYVSLTGDMLDVKVISAYKDHQATIRLQYIEELNYPLMYVEKLD